ncbi:/ / type III restriction-modification system methylase / 576815:578464 Forward [Candidatus Hepatoplasma crinochetorum]|uniref:/ / type III restriction-modification system methylase / 576815:578464 Forward n=1 Tax=Candidatus Hepatoplasma crinochetorum TaxID=295596 RepID=A0A0G7ZMX2_9MOLU|nr:/ / type III restriction-modification system methylase / 576815:578464 Forward [Candidatus Hepatoplasma crinochetorum]
MEITAEERINLQKKLNNKEKLNNDEIEKLINLLDQTKLGLKLFYSQKEETIKGKNIKNYYYFFEEINNLEIKNANKKSNLLIEGDNYFALKHLIKINQKVDIIYIDPPYNTKNKDFIYNDIIISKDDDFKHSKWLSFMKRRLKLAQKLLSDNGVIFVSIDDNEQAYLKVLMDEIFGEENFVSNIFVESNPSGRSDSKDIANSGDYLLIYAKNKLINEFNKIIFDPKESDLKGYSIQKVGSNSRREDRPNLYYPIYINYETQKILLDNFEKSIKIFPKLSNNEDGRWIYSKETLQSMIEKNLIEIVKNTKNKYIIKWLDKEKKEGLDLKLKSSWHTNGIYSLSNSVAKIQLLSIINSKEAESMTPKNIDLLKLIIKFSSSNKNSIILDFFAGSGTTGHAVMQLNKEDNGNRQFILIEKENNIAKDICYERLYRIINGKGTKGKQDFKWLKKNKPYLKENLKYIKIKLEDKINGNYEEIESSKDLYKSSFNISNININEIS